MAVAVFCGVARRKERVLFFGEAAEDEDEEEEEEEDDFDDDPDLDIILATTAFTDGIAGGVGNAGIAGDWAMAKGMSKAQHTFVFGAV